jgi:ubiquinone/menaquinone biosynthesis C-methylase UbiE
VTHDASDTTYSFESVNKAFSRQSLVFDEEDKTNPILQSMRNQVYAHVDRFIKPNSRILELNAGTGIDALRLVTQGHSVHATDLSDGMISQLHHKIDKHRLSGVLTCQQVSFERLDEIRETGFDYVFSNFGGLNCSSDLAKVTRHLPRLLRPGAFATWVIMPPVCLWEIAGLFKGNFANAFRRFRRNGVLAHIEGYYFPTYYHSLDRITEAFGDSFELIACEGLASLTPPPHAQGFVRSYPRIYGFLKRIDRRLSKHFPFNRWADHIVVTFKFKQYE